MYDIFQNKLIYQKINFKIKQLKIQLQKEFYRKQAFEIPLQKINKNQSDLEYNINTSKHQMLIIYKLVKILSTVLARYQLQLNVHPIIYLLFFFIAADHFWITVLQETSQMMTILKWLDISYFHYQFDPKILLYIIIPMVILPFILIIAQVHNAIKYPKIKMLIFQKYSIKIIGSLGLFMSSGFMLTTIRTCVNIFWLGQFDVHYYLAWIIIAIYTVILLPFYGLFIVDFSSNSNIVYSSLTYINFQRWMPLMRVAFVYSNIFQKLAHVSLAYIFLPIALFWIFKEPICHYNYDKHFRSIIFGMCWIIVIRLVQNIFGQQISNGIICVGCPMFIVFLFWITQIRIKKLVKRQIPTVKQIKVLVSFLNDYKNNINQLINFLLNHQKKCEDPECLCHFLQAIIVQNKQKKIIWYKLISYIIGSHFNEKSLHQLSKKKKLKLLQKLTDLSIVQADYLAKAQNKRNKGLYLLDIIKQEIEQEQFYYLNFRAYYQRFIVELETKIVYDCKQEGTINNYALNYYEYHKKIQNMIVLMRQSTLKHQNFWVELLKFQPDTQKIIKCIKKAYQCNLQVQMIIKDLISEKSIESMIFPIYATYYDKVINKRISKQPFIVEKAQKISQNIKFFSCQSKTSSCVVNANNGEQFGKLIHSNLHFEQLTGHSYQDHKTVDSFILSPYIKTHRQQMERFINQGLYYAQRKKVIMKNLSQNIFYTDLIIQLYPSLKDGLNVCCFFIPLPGQIIFITNIKGQIIYYSHQFQEEMIQKNQVQELEEVINQKMFLELKQTKSLVYYLRQIKYKIVLQSELTFKDLSPLYIFTINNVIDESSKQQYQKDQKDQDQNTSQEFLSLKSNKPHKVSFLTHTYNSPLYRNQYKYNGVLKSKIISELQQVNQKQLQNIKQKFKKEKEKLQRIFNIVKNNKKCRNINLWLLFTLVSFLILISLIIFNIFLLKQKVSSLEKDKNIRQEYQQLRLSIYDILYSMRMANLEANIGKNETLFNFYIKDMKKQKDIAIQLNKQLSFRPYFQIQQFQVDQSDQIQLQHQAFFVILQFYVLTSLSNVASGTMNDLSFSFSRLDIPNPLNHFEANFLKANLNGLYLLIPNFEKIWQMKSQQLNCNLGKCFQKESAIVSNPIGIIVSILILIGTIFIIIKIKDLKENSYVLFEALTLQYIQSRKQSVQIYRKQNFPQITHAKQLQQQRVLRANGPPMKSYELFKNSALLKFKDSRQGSEQFSQTLKPSSTIFAKIKVQSSALQQDKCRQNTQRQMVTNDLQQSPQEQSNQNTDDVKNGSKKQDDRKYIEFNRQSLNSLILSYICLFLPLMLYFIATIILFVVGINFILQHFENKDLIYNQIRQGKAVKLYTYQLGMDNGQIQEYEGPSIPQLLNQSISNLYQAQREIISKIINGKPYSQTTQFMNLFNQNNVCANLQQLTNLEPNNEVKFTEQECNSQLGSFYLTKGRRSAIIAYLQAARLLFERNRNSDSYTINQRLQYLQTKSLKVMSSLQNYFDKIQRESLRIYSNEFYRLITNFQISVNTITGFCLIFVLVLIFVLLKFARRKLFNDTLQIKAIFHIISQNTIKQNNQLRDFVTEKANYNFIK